MPIIYLLASHTSRRCQYTEYEGSYDRMNQKGLERKRSLSNRGTISTIARNGWRKLWISSIRMGRVPLKTLIRHLLKNTSHKFRRCSQLTGWELRTADLRLYNIVFHGDHLRLGIKIECVSQLQQTLFIPCCPPCVHIYLYEDKVTYYIHVN